MKRWSESTTIWRRAREAAAEGRPAAMATLFELEGSGYRRPGAKMLILPDGATLGGVSAGCVEADLVERAREILDGAPARVVEYATGGAEEPPWGLRTGCEGRFRVLLERVSPPPAAPELHAVEAAIAEAAPFAVATRAGGAPRRLVVGPGGRRAGSLGDARADRLSEARARERLESERPGVESLGGDDFLEVLFPPPRLTIVGAGPDADPLVRLALEAGFLVRLVDHRSDLLDRPLDPRVDLERTRPGDPWPWETPGGRCFVVLKTHSLDHDRAWMRTVFAAGRPAYVGVLGSRKRGREVARTAPRGARDRIYAPIGLDLGAEGPEQIAVSAIAEMLAVRSRRGAGHLRNGSGSLHGASAT